VSDADFEKQRLTLKLMNQVVEHTLVLAIGWNF